MMYRYYSLLGFLQIKHNEEGKYIHNEISNNIPHFIKKSLHVDCIQDGFFIYKKKIILCRRKSIPSNIDYMIPEYFCKTNSSIVNFNNYDITYKFEFF